MNKSILGLFAATVVMLGMGTPSIVQAQEKMVGDGSVVKMNYTLTVDGEVVDSSEGRGPLEYTHGTQQIIPGLEAALAGLKAGEKKSVAVEPKDGYGEEIPDAFKEVEKTMFPEGFEFKENIIIEMTSPEGASLPATITEVKENTVVLNFNHPLAGKTLNFDIEIVSVE